MYVVGIAARCRIGDLLSAVDAVRIAGAGADALNEQLEPAAFECLQRSAIVPSGHVQLDIHARGGRSPQAEARTVAGQLGPERHRMTTLHPGGRICCRSAKLRPASS